MLAHLVLHGLQIFWIGKLSKQLLHKSHYNISTIIRVKLLWNNFIVKLLRISATETFFKRDMLCLPTYWSAVVRNSMAFDMNYILLSSHSFCFLKFQRVLELNDIFFNVFISYFFIFPFLSSRIIAFWREKCQGVLGDEMLISEWCRWYAIYKKCYCIKDLWGPSHLLWPLLKMRNGKVLHDQTKSLRENHIYKNVFLCCRNRISGPGKNKVGAVLGHQNQPERMWNESISCHRSFFYNREG